jgi:segregation and condensation protein B
MSDGKIEEKVETGDPQSRISDLLESNLDSTVEALLFASPDPLSAREIGRIIGRDRRRTEELIEELNRKYAEWGRSFRIEKYGDKFRFYTLPDFNQYISRLADIPRPIRLSRAALEVLSIVAYKQPVVRSEIERIRGVNADSVLRTLLEKGLIEVCGRSDGPGRPLLYRTTWDFLEFFGISDLAELPVPETADDDSPGRRYVMKRLAEESDSAASADEIE